MCETGICSDYLLQVYFRHPRGLTSFLNQYTRFTAVRVARKKNVVSYFTMLECVKDIASLAYH